MSLLSSPLLSCLVRARNTISSQWRPVNYTKKSQQPVSLICEKQVRGGMMTDYDYPSYIYPFVRGSVGPLVRGSVSTRDIIHPA